MSEAAMSGVMIPMKSSGPTSRSRSAASDVRTSRELATFVKYVSRNTTKVLARPPGGWSGPSMTCSNDSIFCGTSSSTTSTSDARRSVTGSPEDVGYTSSRTRVGSSGAAGGACAARIDPLTQPADRATANRSLRERTDGVMRRSRKRCSGRVRTEAATERGGEHPREEANHGEHDERHDERGE